MAVLAKTNYIELDLVTYGSQKFDPDLWEDVKNRNRIKPKGGLWASTIEHEGWKNWCQDNEYWGDFDFTIEKFFTKYIGNTVIIDSLGDMEYKLEWYQIDPDSAFDFYAIDFEKMLNDGVDAIYLTPKGQLETHMPEGCRGRDLYGWDCESIIIMNKDCISELKQ